MSEKRFTTQRIYKGFDGEKIYDWCVMDYDNVLLRLTTRLDCKDVCEELNALHEENQAIKLDNKLLLGEMKAIRDKLTVYLKVTGGE